MVGIDDEMPKFAKRPQHDIQNFSLTLERNLLKSEVVKYLHDKLAKRLNVSTVRVPWSKMKAEDILNWPLDVKLISIEKMNFNDLKKLNELARKDKLDFSAEFLGRLQDDTLQLKVANQWSRDRSSISQTRKRTFDEVETIDALQDGI